MSYSSLSEIDSIYHAQLKFKKEAKFSSYQKRISWLKDLLKEITLREAEIQRALYDDFHKSAIESEITEILAVELELKHIIRNLGKWMQDQGVKWRLLLGNTRAYMHYEPKGNALIISPWNYPFQLPLVHLASCIAAGNTAILKLSEFSPHTNGVIKKIIQRVFSAEHVTIIEGSVVEATYLLKLKFDHIHFTGSPQVGKIIMQAASKNLSDVTLELGGKSPAIIDRNVNLKKVVKNIIWAKFVNAGQTCIAPDYLLVHKHQKNEIEELFKQEIELAFGKEPQNSPDYARIINDKQFDRLQSALEDAISLGAKVISGGIMDQSERYIAPTVVTRVALTNPLMTDEIFGPVLPIIYYEKINQAIDFIAANEKPLALYIFSKDSHFCKHVIAQTSAGSTCINDAMIQIMHPSLPFGGVNHSGIGQSTGWFGFKSFSHQRAVADVKIYPISALFWFPYTEKTYQVLKWIKKLF